MTNLTGNNLVQDFDLKINKNAFALGVTGATNKLTLPAPNQTSTAKIECCIDKKNLDGKNPPKNPFNIQIAMKTSLAVFIFQVPALLTCFFKYDKEVSGEEFDRFWAKIKATNKFNLDFQQTELYQGYAKAEDQDSLRELLCQGFKANGFSVVSFDSASGVTKLGAMTVNNLPILLEMEVSAFMSIEITYGVPVLPIKDLVLDSLKQIVTHSA